MLLWVTVMGLAGGFVALVERRLPERTMLATLAGQAFVSLGACERSFTNPWCASQKHPCVSCVILSVCHTSPRCSQNRIATILLEIGPPVSRKRSKAARWNSPFKAG